MFPTKVLKVPYKAAYIMFLANIHVTNPWNTGFSQFMAITFGLETLYDQY